MQIYKTTQYRHILQCDSAGPLPVHCRHMHNMGAPMPPPDCRPAWRQGRHTYAVPHLLIFILCDGDSRSIFCQAVEQLQHRVETHSPLPWRAIAVFHSLDSSLRSCKNSSHDGGPCGARICQAADELQHSVEARSPMPRGADRKTR